MSLTVSKGQRYCIFLDSLKCWVEICKAGLVVWSAASLGLGRSNKHYLSEDFKVDLDTGFSRGNVFSPATSSFLHRDISVTTAIINNSIEDALLRLPVVIYSCSWGMFSKWSHGQLLFLVCITTVLIDHDLLSCKCWRSSKQKDSSCHK